MNNPVDHESLYFDYREYPFVRPAEMGGGESEHPVIVVGGGPVGMTVALELALYGVRSTILQAGRFESAGSRAACISRRSMEILWRCGLGKAFEETALPWTSGTSYYRQTPIFRLEMPHGEDERHYPMANIQQNILERMMIEQIDRTDLIELRWQNTVCGVQQGRDGVTVSVETPEGHYETRAQYLVAADGARSTMRKLTQLRMSGESHGARYLIADIQLETDSPTERRAWFDSAVNRGSTVLMHRQPHNIWRVDCQLRDGDDADEEMKPERLKQRIQAVLDMAGESGKWQLDWVSLYKAYSLCLDNYVHDRVCFVGDAAHLVPIFGVKGLNSGLADANNIGWKLAAKIKGKAGPNLLGSYNTERRGATLDIFREAGKSTRFMTPPTRGYQLLRKAVLSLALTEDWAGKLADPRQSAPFCYSESPLNFSEGNDEFSAGPVLGASAPSVKLDRGYLHDFFEEKPVALYHAGTEQDGKFFDLVQKLANDGHELTLLVAGNAPGSAPANAKQIEDSQGRLAEKYGMAPGSFYLLRPDWHVAARTRTVPSREYVDKAIKRMWGHDA